MVDIISKLVESGQKLMAYLTLAGIGKLALLLLLIFMSVFAWEHRPVIYKTIAAGPVQAATLRFIGNTTKTSMAEMVTRHPNIIAIQIVGIDFLRNTRETVFFHSEFKELQREFDYFQDTKVGNIPMLAVGDEGENTRMIQIWSTEFVCTEISPRMLSILPASPKYATQVCSISVPPLSEKMIGYISFWMKDPIKREDLGYYQSLARSTANQIYERDGMNPP